MNLQGKRVMVLGGPGLVGLAVCRRLLRHDPAALIVTALTQDECEAGLTELAADLDRAKARASANGSSLEVSTASGNIFVRDEFKTLSRREILGDPARRERFVCDTLDPLDETLTQASALYQLVKAHQPDVVVDCVNTATALAYQDIFSAGRRVHEQIRQGAASIDLPEFLSQVEGLIGTLYIPQLIRHIQLLWRSLTDFQVHTYLKVGTSGTGGLGLNIPYTHSEDKPSSVLMAKAAIAGAHTLMLFLLGRTAASGDYGLDDAVDQDRNAKRPAPVVKEVKPTATIAWKRIGYGEILQKGQPVPLIDHAPEQALDFSRSLYPADTPWQSVQGKVLEAPFIDTGENGIFSRGEFEAITDEGQMEFITPEEIAETVERELVGGNSGADLVAAMDAAVLGPTYRAGVMRSRAIQKLRDMEKSHNQPSIAFENLGPPRLSKLLYEAYLITRRVRLLEPATLNPSELSQACAELIQGDASLRSRILSVGLPIILPDSRVLRGPNLVIPTAWDLPEDRIVSAERLDRYAHQGWVDLRESNMDRWLSRLETLREEAHHPEATRTGSSYVRDKTYWQTVADQESYGSLVSWIFIREDDGERLKR